MPVHSVVIEKEMQGRSIRSVALSALGMSSSQFKRAKFQGYLKLDDEKVTADVRVEAGQKLEIFVPEKTVSLPSAVKMPVHIIYEDDWFWVIDKPAPLPSAPSASQDTPTLENALYHHLGCPEGFVYRPVNRLDKGTSGLMLVAKDAHSQYLLQKILHTEDFIREYLAVVDGTLENEEGVVYAPIAKADGATVRREVRPDGKEARTFYRVVQKGSRSLVHLKLDTGRTHQIRVHMSHLGCPVTGDFLYGTEIEALPGRFALHSAWVHIKHPVTGERLTFESPLPDALAGLL